MNQVFGEKKTLCNEISGNDRFVSGRYSSFVMGVSDSMPKKKAAILIVNYTSSNR